MKGKIFLLCLLPPFLYCVFIFIVVPQIKLLTPFYSIKSNSPSNNLPEKNLIGVIKKCIPPDRPNVWDCGRCYKYIINNGNEKILFNDESYPFLFLFKDKRVKLTGFEDYMATFSCPKIFKATKILLFP